VRAMNLSASATIAAAALMVGLGSTPAHADINNPALNGVWRVTTNGEWARTNDSYHDEVSIQQIWTIKSSCINPGNCTGTVTSDQGWTANLVRRAGGMGFWEVIRYLPNWETCGDGTAATGREVINFYPVGEDLVRLVDPDSTTFSGESETTGPSGACGYNNLLQITQPIKLVKIG
jgi:hypothetical protein